MNELTRFSKQFPSFQLIWEMKSPQSLTSYMCITLSYGKCQLINYEIALRLAWEVMPILTVAMNILQSSWRSMTTIGRKLGGLTTKWIIRQYASYSKDRLSFTFPNTFVSALWYKCYKSRISWSITIHVIEPSITYSARKSFHCTN